MTCGNLLLGGKRTTVQEGVYEEIILTVNKASG